MKIAVFLGPPGCGKGTQSSYLVKQQGFVQLSTGDMLREFVKEDSDFAKETKSVMDIGGLISDEIIITLIEDKLKNLPKDIKGVILDGFPRTLIQGKALDVMLNELNRKLDYVIKFNASDDILLKRITGRYICAHCNEGYNKFFNNPKKEGVCDVCEHTEFKSRADDTENTVKVRLKTYNNTTSHLVDYYKNKNILYNIDATQSFETVLQDLLEIII